MQERVTTVSHKNKDIPRALWGPLSSLSQPALEELSIHEQPIIELERLNIPKNEVKTLVKQLHQIFI